jgi:hypothetical protein
MLHKLPFVNVVRSYDSKSWAPGNSASSADVQFRAAPGLDSALGGRLGLEVHCKLEHYGAMHQPAIVTQSFLGCLSDTLHNNPSQNRPDH